MRNPGAPVSWPAASFSRCTRPRRSTSEAKTLGAWRSSILTSMAGVSPPMRSRRCSRIPPCSRVRIPRADRNGVFAGLADPEATDRAAAGGDHGALFALGVHRPREVLHRPARKTRHRVVIHARKDGPDLDALLRGAVGAYGDQRDVEDLACAHHAFSWLSHADVQRCGMHDAHEPARKRLAVDVGDGGLDEIAHRTAARGRVDREAEGDAPGAV